MAFAFCGGSLNETENNARGIISVGCPILDPQARNFVLSLFAFLTSKHKSTPTTIDSEVCVNEVKDRKKLLPPRTPWPVKSLKMNVKKLLRSATSERLRMQAFVVFLVRRPTSQQKACIG